MAGPFTFPVAQAVPFESNRNGSGLQSQDVQSAIEEVKNDAIDNDRYQVSVFYNGNANNGRYLEAFPGIDTFDAPIIIPENSVIRTVTLGTVSNSGPFSVSLFKTTNLTTPILTLTLNSGVDRQVFQNLTVMLNSLDQIAVRITSGSRNKPFMRLFINTVSV